MATGKTVENLQDEATCAVCLDFFQDPVMLLGCGHNFCRGCIERVSADAEGAGCCPQCRFSFSPGDFRPNRQLANVVVAVRELAKPVAEEFCRRHRQPLSFFCRRDGILLCGSCAESRAQPAVPLEEAAREYREQFRASLKLLQEEDERLSGLVASAEETRQEMLDAQMTLNRCAAWKSRPLQPPAPELEAELEDFALKANMLAEAATRFKDILGSWSEEDMGGYRRATVTLDPATAHPQILVSADGRRAERRECPPLPPPPGAERFESLRCVLGRQGFAGGRHRWAVEVRPGPDWALGVAREFISRKGCFGLSPERGVWAVGQWLGKLRALTWPSPTSLPHGRVPRRIEVALDYPGGRVAFRDADSEAEIFTFPPAAFAGERLRPLLWLGEGPALLTLCP